MMARYGVSSSAARRSNVASSGGRSPATRRSLLMVSSSRSLPAAAARAQSCVVCDTSQPKETFSDRESNTNFTLRTQRQKTPPCQGAAC